MSEDRKKSVNYEIYERSAVWPWFFLWTLGVILISTIMLLFDSSKLIIALAPLLLLSLISLVNEAYGVILFEDRVTFPKRLFESFPLLMLGRGTMALRDIYILELSGDGDIQKCILLTTQLRRTAIYFPDRATSARFIFTAMDRDGEFNFFESPRKPGIMTNSYVFSGVNVVLALFAIALIGSPYYASIFKDNAKTFSDRGKAANGLSRSTGNEQVEPNFMVYAASYDWTSTSKKKIQKTLEDIQKCSGVSLKITTNSDYKFFSPVKKWLITAGPFIEKEANITKKKLVSCGAIDASIKELEVE